MRCTRIEFFGYRRLAQTGCNLSGKLTAFIGPNEAGKSTVLEGLEWLSDEDREAIEPRNETRRVDGQQPATQIKALFLLDKHDLTAIEEHKPAPKVSYTFAFEAHADGKEQASLSPSLLRPFDPAVPAREALQSILTKYSKPEGESNEAILPMVSQLLEGISEPLDEWDSDHFDPAETIIEWLEQDGLRNGESPADSDLATKIRQSVEVFRQPHPHDAAIAVLSERRPKFLLFKDVDRQLSESYNLEHEHGNPKPALSNLIAVADLDLAALWTAIQNQNISLRNRLLLAAEKRIRERLAPYWTQTEIVVHLTTDGGQLEIAIEDESGTPARFSDRSEGLKTFVTLVAFIARQDHEVPPILLIDEAETHLHLDAQGDLIKALQQQTAASQVLYSTHSPGCLPTDLGTGIRLVKRHATAESSELVNNLWHEQQPGSFSPLLYAMGAGAAAFGALRWAVVTEGVTDMMLLPSLIKLANGLPDLMYHVAPGLVSTIGANLIAEETATKVIYLVDGDGEGDRYKAELKALKIPMKRVLSHPKHMTLEDLINPTLYLEAANAVRGYQGLPAITLPASDRFPIAAAIRRAAGGKDAKFSKSDVAAELLENPEALKLSRRGLTYLQRLHPQLMAHFEGS